MFMTMKKIFAFLLPVFIGFQGFTADINNLDDFFKQADIFFKKYVHNGLVDYNTLATQPNELISLVRYMESVDFNTGKPHRDYVKAFWINAYNLTTIKSVVFKYPLASPLDDTNFFTGEKHNVAGEQLTLGDIEKKKLINPFNDERIHFVIVCAAKGCPKLTNFAYSPDKLESQILSQTKKSMNDDYFIRVSLAAEKVEVSEIFDWYKSDFTNTGEDILSYINQYRNSPIPSGFSLEHYTYDWALNEKKK